MSCFVCEDRVFQNVVKVLNQSAKSQGKEFSLEFCNELLKMVAELNCRNVATRYDEEQMEIEVTLFDKIPNEPITAQDIKDCDCWMYQTCDYYDDEELYKLVATARDWAKLVTKYSQQEYEEALWG